MLNPPSKAKIWLLSLVTLGFYFYYWCVRSQIDVNRSAKQQIVPSCWYLAVPGLNYYWMWLYTEALQKVSYNRIKATDVFLVYVICTSFLGLPLSIGNFFNSSSSSNDSLGAVSPSLQTVLLVVGLLIAFAALANAVGLAFYMNYVQGKISALPRAERT